MVDSGIVFDIQRYSIHDGPGIRTLVFLKGCPLNCLWCANPESRSFNPQLFYSRSRCIHCGRCVRAVPDKGIVMDENGELKIDFNLLNKKEFSWVKVCPSNALYIKGRKMSAEEVFAAVMQDEVFYRESGGGITLSGGEPLVQLEFAKAILMQARQHVVSTAIETSGEVPLDDLLLISHYTDLFLFDFKIFDEEQHYKYTRISNKRIKENLCALSKEKIPILVRMPLIPGINDNQDNIQKTLMFLKELGIKRFIILPFHQYGSGKYASIGIPYALQTLHPPEAMAIEKIRNQIAEAGFQQE